MDPASTLLKRDTETELEKAFKSAMQLLNQAPVSISQAATPVSFRELVRSASEPEEKAERARVWKQAQNTRKKWVQLGLWNGRTKDSRISSRKTQALPISSCPERRTVEVLFSLGFSLTSISWQVGCGDFSRVNLLVELSGPVLRAV